MTRLDISSNDIDIGATCTKALTEGLKGNQIMTELDISSNSMGKAGAIALADIIPGMGALSMLNLAKNGFQGAEAGKAVGDAIAVNTVIKERDISGGESYSERCNVE